MGNKGKKQNKNKTNNQTTTTRKNIIHDNNITCRHQLKVTIKTHKASIIFPISYRHRYPSCQSTYRAATKFLHPYLSLASLWMVPQLCFIFCISLCTILCQFVFGQPRFRFPSAVQRIVTLVMELVFLRSTCPIYCHRFLVMMVSMSSWWHRAKRSRLEMILGRKMSWVYLRLVWRDDSLARSCSIIRQHSDPYRRIDDTQLWQSFSLMLYCDSLQTAFRLLKAFLALLSLIWMSSLVPPFCLTTLPR